MKWWRIKSDGEVYQSEKGDYIIVTCLDKDSELDYELRLVYDNCVQEIRIRTVEDFKDRMIKMLQKDAEDVKKSDLRIFLN
ncbi:MAG: hypothetical protein ACOC56_03510 [Atribacterota bacterium]